MNRTMRAVACWVMLVSVGAVVCPAQAQTGKHTARKVVKLRLNGPMTEAPSDAAGLMAMLQKEDVTTLYDCVKMIHRATDDKDVAGLVLIIEEPEMTLAQVEEVTRALQAFKAKGKPVYCYMDQANNLTYAIAVAADHITLAEYSELDIVGLHAELMFFKGLMDKIGIEADMLHCGAYKSALEPFTRTEPSPEAAENINWLLDGIYNRWVQLIADGRKLSAEEVKKLIDTAPLSAATALKEKLVDDVSSFGAFGKKVRKEFGSDAIIVKDYSKTEGPEIDFDNPFAGLMELFSHLTESETPAKTAGVGLIYIDGGIVVGPSDEGAFGGQTAGSTTVRAAFEKAREDANIKAVVVRVNSPGGSALASDIIWKAATYCAEEKPLIVSMGGVAGSGGYYVAIPGQTIFAEPTTITGSIGVVGGKIVWKGLFQDKLGLTTTEFKRGKHSDLMSTNRKWTDDERAWMQKYMDEVYTQFKGRVTKSRGDRIKKDLEEIAGGRVYTGTQAVDLGLVDKLGGLSDALDFAAGKAGLGRDYEVVPIPKPSGFAEFVNLLQKLMGEEKDDDFKITAGTALRHDPLLKAALPLLQELAPAQVRELFRGLRDLLILRQERVGCFMPLVPHIR